MSAGVVLCGGRSSRMGRPKALLPWRSRTLIEHVVSVLHEVVEEVVVVSSADLSLPPLDCKLVVDREPGLGPLAGIREGLHAIRSDWAYVTSTDAPFLSSAFVRRLLSFGKPAAPDVDGYVQTLAAVYPRAAAAKADALLQDGRMRPLYLLEAVDFRRVTRAELDADVQALQTVNTPEEYLAAVRECDPAASARLELRGRVRARFGPAALEVPVGTLGEVMAHLGGAPLEQYFFWLNGDPLDRDPAIPIGPGDEVIVTHADGGG